MTDIAKWLLVLTTSPDHAVAKALANKLVQSGAAACVNILPGVTSVFHWQGQVQHEQEELLLIKTPASRYEAVEQVIRANHPYEVPEIIALPVRGGLTEYLAWLEQSTGIRDQ